MTSKTGNGDQIAELRQQLDRVYGMEPDAAVERLIGIYKHAKSLQDALADIGKDAKEIMSEIMVETGVTDWSTASGKCYMSKPGISIRYDTKKLDALIAVDEKIADLLTPYRVEKERPGVMFIK